MKLQWRSISSEQEERFTAFRERKTQVEKDVSRTDRAHSFFEGDENKNVELLQDILMTYVMYNFDLGYVQVLLVDRSLFYVFTKISFLIIFLGNVRPTRSHFVRNAKRGRCILVLRWFHEKSSIQL